MTTPLQQAAQAMIDRWESPDWKDTPHTAHYIAELRKALNAELAQSVEPVCSQCKGLGYYDEGHENDDGSMSGGNYVDCGKCHPPQPQATYSDSTPLLHVGNSSFEDWFQERDRAGKSDKQLAREAYAAGMGDPLVTYAAAQGEKP